MSAQLDCTLKIYNRGKLAGKFAIFFNTDKAKKIAKALNLKNDILAAETTETRLTNARALLNRNKLYYDEIEVH